MSRSTLRKHLVNAGTIVVLAVVGATLGSAQNSTPQAPPDRTHLDEILRGMNRGHSFGQVAISPDGKLLAWIEGGRGGGQILVAPPADLAKSQHVTAATKPDQRCREGEFAWEPDSKGLAFFSDYCRSGQASRSFTSPDSTAARRETPDGRTWIGRSPLLRHRTGTGSPFSL